MILVQYILFLKLCIVHCRRGACSPSPFCLGTLDGLPSACKKFLAHQATHTTFSLTPWAAELDLGACTKTAQAMWTPTHHHDTTHSIAVPLCFFICVFLCWEIYLLLLLILLRQLYNYIKNFLTRQFLEGQIVTVLFCPCLTTPS
jgi:hypothetical protein